MKKIKPDKRCLVLRGKLITEKKKGFKAPDRPAAAFYCVQKGLKYGQTDNESRFINRSIYKL